MRRRTDCPGDENERKVEAAFELELTGSAPKNLPGLNHQILIIDFKNKKPRWRIRGTLVLNVDVAYVNPSIKQRLKTLKEPGARCWFHIKRILK